MGNYAGLTVLGANRYDNLGRTVADAGDVNGDGFADFLVVAPYADISGPNRNDGAVYVVFGTADGPATLEVADLDGSNGYLLTQNRDPESFYSGFVRQVAGIGDINGDGFDDIAIVGRTTINYSYGQDRTATTDIFVVFGAATVPGAVVDIDDAPGFQVFGVNGRINDIAAAGDVNGDDVDDFLISQTPLTISGYYGGVLQRATGQGPDGSIDPNGSYGGFVIFGDSNIGGAGDLDVAQLDGTDGFAIAIERSNVRGYFGEIGYSEAYSSSVTAIGDVNGDGFGDLFVRSTVATRQLVEGTDFYGNPFSYYNNVTERRSFVVFGDNDGFDNVIDPTDPTQASEVFWDGVNSDNSGRYSTANRVERLGDINGDGFDDVGVALRGRSIVVPDPDGDRYVTGGVAIYLGGPDGIDVEGDRDGDFDGQVDGLPPSGNPDQFAPGPDLVVVDSRSNYVGLGFSVAGIGDINGDGFDDFAISAPYVFNIPTASRTEVSAAVVIDQVDRPSVFVVFGREIETNGAQVIDLADNNTFGYRIESSQNNNYTGFGRSISAAGDLNNDGFDDFIIGEGFFNAPETPGSSEGAAFVVFGGLNGLESADNADGANDNVISVANLDVDVGTGVVPIQVSIQDAGQFGAFFSEGDAGVTNARFVLQRTGNLTEGVTVNFDVAGFGVNAADAADFLAGATTGSVTFAAGSAFAFLDIAIQGDRAIEATEDFSVTISNAVSTGGSPISITGSQSFGRIFNDDEPVFVQVFGLSRNENDPAGVGFRVQRFGDTDVEVTFNFEITGLSASSDDVVGGLPRLGSITLAAGETFRDILIDPTDDFIIEANETIRIQLTDIAAPDAEQLTVFNTTATATIINDDFGPRITLFGGGNFFEGNDGSTLVTFTVERSGSLDGALTVDFAFTPRAGFQGANSADVTVPLPSTGQLNFADGQASQTITLSILGDRVIEPNEFFDLRITGFESEANIDYELFQISRTVGILNDDGRPPVIPPGVEADVFGDPHIITLDGLGYDFQAVGEYVLVETLPGDPNPFSVQVRFEPLPGSDLVSVTTRMAVEVDGVTIEIDALGDTPLLIDGEAPTAEQLALGAIDVNNDGAADVFFDAGLGEFFVVLNSANEQLKIGRGDGLLNVCVFLSDLEGGHAGAVRGLMGNGNGSLGDDFQLRSGDPLPNGAQTFLAGVPTLDFDFLYGRGEFTGIGYADSWRLAAGEALFSSSVDFPAGFPFAALSLDDLPPDLLAAAIAAATAAGLDPTDEVIFNAAVLDFALTGDDQFLNGALGLAADPQADSPVTGAPALPAVVGVTAGEGSVVEGDSGISAALFTFYRIGDTSAAITVDYAIGGDVDAADLAPGTALTGQVTFAAGARSASISIGIAGDTASELDEDLTVRITGASDTAALVAAARVTTVIETDDFAPEAEDDTFSTAANESLSGNLFENNENGADSDADNDTLTVVGLSVGAVGELITLDSGAILRVGADGALTFDAFGNAGDAFDSDYDALGAGEVASETFTYQVTDGNGGIDTATVTINVTGRNDGPVVIEDLSASFGEDDSIAVNLLDPALVADPDGDDLDLSSVTINAGGRVILSSVDLETGALSLDSGQFNDLAEGEELVVTVDYTVTDGAASATTSATLTITGTNDGPTVLDQGAFTTNEDTGLDIALLDPALVTDVDGDDLRLVSVTFSASDGRTVQATIDSDTGVVSLAPAQFNDLAEGEEITITLDHVITDGLESVENTATLVVVGRNDGPVVLAAGAFTAGEDAATLTAQLLGAALVADPDGDDLDIGTATVTSADGRTINFTVDAETGALQLAAGQFNDLAQGETLVLDIDYTATDGLASVDNTASLTITGANDGPSVRAQGSFSFGEDAAVSSFNLLTADLVADVDGDDLDLGTVAITASDGRVVGFTTDAETGQVTLTAGQFNNLRAGQSLTLTVAHTVTDGLAAANNTATVTITGANDAPTFVSGNAFSVAENSTAVGTVRGQDVDAGTTLSYSIQGGADAARFAINASTGALSFVAAPNFEAPTDVGGNNVYNVRVGVNDGTALVTQDIAVTVTDVAENVRRVIEGTNGIDALRGTRADEILRSKAGLADFLTGGGGSDIFEFGSELTNGRRELDTITDFRSDDFLELGSAHIVRELNFLGSTFLTLSGDGDVIVLLGLRDFTDAQLI